MFGFTYVPLIILVCIPIGIYFYSLYMNSYWKRNKVPFVPANPIVGNLLDAMLFRKCVAEVFAHIYNYKRSIDKPLVGCMLFHKPAFFIRDPELIKQVLVKDFASFNDRYVLTQFSTSIFFTRD